MISDEEYFITTETDEAGEPMTFAMIEDESGDVYWGFGHQKNDDFTAEINRWLVWTGTVTVPEDLIQIGTPVEHLYARWDDEHRERFSVKEFDDGEHAFLVTRLIL